MSDSRQNEYTALIAGYHVGKPKFTEWVYTLTEPFRVARERLAEMQRDFDVDTAIGVQLDAVGARVGISRTLPVTLTGVYFSLDGDGSVGLDRGVWKGLYDPDDGLVTLGDETYRGVIKAKIASNTWDGTMGSLPAFFESIFTSLGVDGKVIDLRDYQTMTVAINLTRATTPPVVWELITRRIIDIVAAGVGTIFTDNVPWFGFDYETESVQGLDEGTWFPFEETSNDDVQLIGDENAAL